MIDLESLLEECYKLLLCALMAEKATVTVVTVSFDLSFDLGCDRVSGVRIRNVFLLLLKRHSVEFLLS